MGYKGGLILIYPKPSSIYFRGIIVFRVFECQELGRFERGICFLGIPGTPMYVEQPLFAQCSRCLGQYFPYSPELRAQSRDWGLG